MGQVEVKLSPREQALFDRVERWRSACPLTDLSAEELRTISQREGIAFATVLLYQCVRESAEHGEFIRRVESYDGSIDLPLEISARLVIVPGAFYREFPHSGADGRLLQQTARVLGIPIEVIPLRSFGSLKDNAAIIADWLQQNDAGSTVLVSLSKGSSDLKTALARPDAADAFRSVRAWVSLSGIFYGTPIVSWLLSRRLRTWWYWFLLSLRGYDFGVVGEMDYDLHAPLAAEMHLPPHLQLIQVVGFPLASHMTSPLAQRMYRRIQHLGPNDGGGTLLADVLRLPGAVYPVWSSDHYLRPAGRDMQHLMRAILYSLSGVPAATAFRAVTRGAER